MIALAEKDWTIKETLSWTEDYLGQYDIPDANVEAEYLIASILNCKRIELHLNPHKIFNPQDMQLFTDFVERRIKREPSQYILGEQEFYGLTFKVNEDVLIPRPETEILVEEAIKTVRSQESDVRSQNTKIHYPELLTPNSEFTILDLCSGSGCIAVTLAKEIAGSTIYATDISEKALNVARENAERHGIAERVTFLCGDLFQSVRDLNLKVDLIVSNPPYISAKVLNELQPEVKNYEPRTALYGGDDGLDFYRGIISGAPKYLTDGGYLILEIGYGQAEEIKKLIEQSNAFKDISVIKDFAGVNRVIKAKIRG